MQPSHTKTLALILVPMFAMASDRYNRNDAADISGTYNLDYVDLAPAFLVAEFGPPAEGDGIRVSGMYTFVSASGEVFTLHDYKSTTLWASDEGLPTVAEFWSSSASHELSVGGKEGTNYEAFVGWIKSAYKAWVGRK